MTFTPFTTTQQLTLEILPKVTATFSIIGSAIPIKEILVCRKKRSKVFYRLFFGLCVVDLITSIFLFLSTWPMPRQSLNVHGAVGTIQTCEVQGFFIQLGLCAPLYNTCLAIYHVCVVRFNLNEASLRRIEIFMHIITLTLGFGTAIAGIPMKLYNPAELWCWIASIPFFCDQGYVSGGVKHGYDCIRGRYASSFRNFFLFYPLFICMAVSTVCSGLLYHAVLKVERRMDRYQFNNNATTSRDRRRSSGSRKHSHQVAFQGMLYFGTFVLTWIFPALLSVIMLSESYLLFPLWLLTAFFNPLQGAFNVMVYLFPRVRKSIKKYRQEGRTSSVLLAIGQNMRSILFRLYPREGEDDGDDYDVEHDETYESQRNTKTFEDERKDTSKDTSNEMKFDESNDISNDMINDNNNTGEKSHHVRFDDHALDNGME